MSRLLLTALTGSSSSSGMAAEAEAAAAGAGALCWSTYSRQHVLGGAAGCMLHRHRCSACHTSRTCGWWCHSFGWAVDKQPPGHSCQSGSLVARCRAHPYASWLISQAVTSCPSCLLL